MTSPAHPRRRWFRFSLRTLFVMVTVFGVWLGWNLHVVRRRAELLRWCQENNVSYLADGDHFREENGSRGFAPSWPEYVRIPYARLFLGDRQVDYIVLEENVPAHKRDEFIAWFPDATFPEGSPSRHEQEIVGPGGSVRMPTVTSTGRPIKPGAKQP